LAAIIGPNTFPSMSVTPAFLAHLQAILAGVERALVIIDVSPVSLF
jgi:hypothetical protein